MEKMKEVRVVRTHPFMMVVEGDTQYKVEFTVSYPLDEENKTFKLVA